MSNKKTHDLVATVGTYTDQNGEDKKRYKNCGFATTNEKGQQSLMIDALPLSKDWSGWINLYPIERQQQSQQQQQQTPPPKRQQPGHNFEADDDIPF
tara:strand:+ start:468 stop:758 length:291 start_codon:yes stop_codon:yes gene_type:complete